MTATSAPRGHGFGALPVFFASISTILGAIMFLRFGYAVGNLGLLGAWVMIALGHAVTIPTALALSEIATNRRVEGGGEYFIISRSFGLRIGSAIGVALYFSQAMSVAFYCIAFAEAFSPWSEGFEQVFGITFDARMVSVPVVAGLGILAVLRGANVGVKALYVVVAILGLSLVLFFLGAPIDGQYQTNWVGSGDGLDPFFVVFAICFPGFTGMTAGVGLSGDLAQPRRSIPLGTLAGTGVGLVVYAAIVYKLATHVPAELLRDDQLVMSQVAVWGPAIPIGLACATLSSAIGSILVAPRTLQALAMDEGLPVGSANRLLAQGVGSVNEPRMATAVTAALALVVTILGSVDAVARLISMFFMLTYGALCSISFLQHFSSSPDYRPSFRSRWYVSLFGAALCVLLMFQIDPVFAVVAFLSMLGLYTLTRYGKSGTAGVGVASMVRGAMRQAEVV